MSERALVQTESPRSSKTTATGALQRRCRKCRKPNLQRSKSSAAAVAVPAVPEGRNSPAANAAAHISPEPRFSYDFSRIQLHSRSPSRIQAKLAVNTPGDIYEREADRIADQVLAMPVAYSLSRRPLTIQRLTGRPAGQIKEAPSSVDRALASSGRPLEPGLRQEMEGRFGHDFSRVRVHAGTAAEQSAREVNANAYTVGQDIVFGAGWFSPESGRGQRLIAHELVHVVQQSSGASALGIQRDDRDSREPEIEAPASSDETRTELAIARDFRYFFFLVKQILKSRGSKLTEDQEFSLQYHLKSLPIQEIKALEKELLLWPRFGKIEKMTRIIEITTSFARKSDVEESRRGRFEEKEGGEIKERLSSEAVDFGFNECLNFLHNASLDELFVDEEQEGVEAAKEEYARGAAERREKTITHARTLSRLASELRLQGLLGPVNILRWKRARGGEGHHEPHPADLFNRLSSAGSGWYFFLVSLVSFHTFIIAVHVGSGGKRKYFEIQGGQSVPKTREELKKWFDEEFPNKKGAYSRVWQVYMRPAD